MIEPPWWLVILPLTAAPLVYLTRHWWLGAYLAAFVSLCTGLLAASLPPTNAIHLGGRTFLLDPLTQQGLAIVFITAAILYVVGWRFRHSRYFLPLGLVVSGLFAIAGMSRHLGITALVMTLAAIASVPIIQGEQHASVRGAWRFVVLMFLALPWFLLAAWRVDMYREDPQNAVMLPQAFVFGGCRLRFLAGRHTHVWLADLNEHRGTAHWRCAAARRLSDAGADHAGPPDGRGSVVYVVGTSRTAVGGGRHRLSRSGRGVGGCTAQPALRNRLYGHVRPGLPVAGTCCSGRQRRCSPVRRIGDARNWADLDRNGDCGSAGGGRAGCPDGHSWNGAPDSAGTGSCC